MSTVIYSVMRRETLFNGYCDQEDIRFDADCWYENTGREKSLEIARKCSDDDDIEINRHGISRNVYEWTALEYDEDDNIVGCEIKIFDPLDRFEKMKEIAKRAYICECDPISYIVGERELIGEFMRNGHWLEVYRYEETEFGDFTAYEKEGKLWLPQTFYDYGVDPNEIVRAIDTGSNFWQDWQTTDPEALTIQDLPE